MLISLLKHRGGKHSGFYDNYVNRSIKELEKSIKSYKKQLAKHQDKLANPEKYVKDWHPTRVKGQEKQIKDWTIEVNNFSEKIEILQGILKERQ
jgi:predicted RNase H-like nuclease (RuvC/YqgF family)